MPEIFSTWEMYIWLIRQYYPEDICPSCGEFHPRTVLLGTFNKGRKLLRWEEECGGIKFEVASLQQEGGIMDKPTEEQYKEFCLQVKAREEAGIPIGLSDLKRLAIELGTPIPRLDKDLNLVWD